MKSKLLSAALALVMLASALTACSEGGGSDTDKTPSSAPVSETADSSSIADSSESDSSETETTTTTTTAESSSETTSETTTSAKQTTAESKSASQKTEKSSVITQPTTKYIPPKTSTSTTRTSSKTSKTTTKSNANYVGKCKYCGRNVTANDSMDFESFRVCYNCRDAKRCVWCGKVCNSNTGRAADRGFWFCYECRPITTQPQQKEITGSDADARKQAQSVVTLTNKLRASKGLSQLKTDSRLTNAAMARAKELAVKFSHGRPWRDDTFIEYEYGLKDIGGAGENIHMGYGTGYHDGEYVFSSLEGSSGHKATMLSKGYNYIGVGVYYVYKDGKKYTYCAQLFTTKAV